MPWFLYFALLAYSAPVQSPLPGFYYPKHNVTSFDTNCTGIHISEQEQVQIAQEFLANHTNGETKVTDKFRGPTSGMLHFKASATVNGVIVANTQMSINVDQCGNVVSCAKAWLTNSKLEKRETLSEMTGKQALIAFAHRMGFSIDPNALTEAPGHVSGSTLISGASFVVQPVFAAPAYLTTKNDGIKKTIELRVRMKGPDYFDAFISQSDSSLLALTNFASSSLYASRSFKRNQDSMLKRNQDSMLKRRNKLVKRQNGTITYNIVSIPNKDFSAGRQIKTDKQLVDSAVSPLGWHRINPGDQPADTLIGNNVIAQENSKNSQDPVATGKRPVASNFNFNFPVDDVNQTPDKYFKASVTNMFVSANFYHDTLYKYGFNELSGNFQTNNFGKGGQANDAVIANAQDGSGIDNSNFLTPPDGQPGIMRMFLFDFVPQKRDGALDNTVLLHELTHGLSTRLTGGPNSGVCLSSTESGGLGEGWSDFMSFALLQKAENTRIDDFVIGAYVTNDKVKGVRSFPYSTNLQKNPRKFSDLANQDNHEIHIIGEIWASMLIEVYWNMVEKLGFSDNVADAASGKGNTAMIQLIVDGFRSQPCNPTFLQARDAIIAADKHRFKGANSCEISKGFAKRGLGANAVESGFEDDFMLPDGC